MSITFAELIASDNAKLAGILAAGTRPLPKNLAGWEFRGYNTPWFTRLLGFQKFIKGFFLDGENLVGYNLFVENPRGGADTPWQPKHGGRPQDRHGFYDVVDPFGRYVNHANAVLLNYGSGRNAAWNPEARIRDLLVQVDAANPDLYLGKAYIDIAVTSVFSNYFVLERLRPAPAA
jgi:hypothetical protein